MQIKLNVKHFWPYKSEKTNINLTLNKIIESSTKKMLKKIIIASIISLSFALKTKHHLSEQEEHDWSPF